MSCATEKVNMIIVKFYLNVRNIVCVRIFFRLGKLHVLRHASLNDRAKIRALHLKHMSYLKAYSHISQREFNDQSMLKKLYFQIGIAMQSNFEVVSIKLKIIT